MAMCSNFRIGNKIAAGTGVTPGQNELIHYFQEDMQSDHFIGLTFESNQEFEGHWKFLRDQGGSIENLTEHS